MTFFMMVFVIVCSGVKIKIELWFLRTGKNTMNSFIVGIARFLLLVLFFFFFPLFSLNGSPKELSAYHLFYYGSTNVLPVSPVSPVFFTVLTKRFFLSGSLNLL